jgi:branched-chain amino acid transport system permease protein
MSPKLKRILIAVGLIIVAIPSVRTIAADPFLFAQLVVTGVMLGSIFALVALGWVLIYKCSGVLNLAMGELTMIGGYVCLYLYTMFVPAMPITQAFVLSLIGTMIIGIILGLLTERLFLRKMIGEPILAVIMVTVGLAFFFKGMVFLIWDPDTQVFYPRIFSIEPIVIWGVAIGQVYLWSFIAALILMAIFVSFFKYTRWGLSMQACADDEMAALSLGVSAKFVYALAWAIAFMAAGVGGTLLGNINGLNYSVSSLGLLVLPVVVFGGLNSVPGAIVGGITIGVLQNIAGGYFDYYFPGGIKEIAPFIFMVIFLLFKPYGLWGWERIERV